MCRRHGESSLGRPCQTCMTRPCPTDTQGASRTLSGPRCNTAAPRARLVRATSRTRTTEPRRRQCTNMRPGWGLGSEKSAWVRENDLIPGHISVGLGLPPPRPRGPSPCAGRGGTRRLAISALLRLAWASQQPFGQRAERPAAAPGTTDRWAVPVRTRHPAALAAQSK